MMETTIFVRKMLVKMESKSNLKNIIRKREYNIDKAVQLLCDEPKVINEPVIIQYPHEMIIGTHRKLHKIKIMFSIGKYNIATDDVHHCSSKGILKGVLELPDSMIDSSVPLHPILQEQPWNIANETYRHKKYRSRENLYKKAAEHYHVKMSNVMVKYDVPHTHLCDDLPMFYSREDYKCIKGL
eukprot:521437_1